MNPITAALAEPTSAHLSELGISVHTAHMSFFGSPVWPPRRHLARTKLTFTDCLPSTKPSPPRFSAPRAFPIAAQIQRDTIQNP